MHAISTANTALLRSQLHEGNAVCIQIQGTHEIQTIMKISDFMLLNALGQTQIMHAL